MKNIKENAQQPEFQFSIWNTRTQEQHDLLEKASAQSFSDEPETPDYPEERHK